MKLPSPPTGGQGGHYGHNPPPAPKLFHKRSGPRRFQYVPERFRGLRLRRRRRRRSTSVNPFMTLVLIAMAAVPLIIIVSMLVHLPDLIFSILR